MASWCIAPALALGKRLNFFREGFMLERILETEVMDSAEEAGDYDTMDHSHVNHLFVSDLLQLRPDIGAMLDVGTGTAQIPIALCRRHPHVHVIAIDMAKHMLQIG